MNEHPIIFSAPMVRAILAGAKMQTRRVLKPHRGREIVNLREAEGDDRYSGRFNDPNSWGYQFLDDGAPAPLAMWPELCPYGKSGDRLWVRETWSHTGTGVWSIDSARRAVDGAPVYRADGGPPGCAWWPSIHMPREFSRITLEITDVSVERLQDIHEHEAEREGAELAFEDPSGIVGSQPSYRHGFVKLWRSINGREAWDANPWVWVVSFSRA